MPQAMELALATPITRPFLPFISWPLGMSKSSAAMGTLTVFCCGFVERMGRGGKFRHGSPCFAAAAVTRRPQCRREVRLAWLYRKFPGGRPEAAMQTTKITASGAARGPVYAFHMTP